MDSIPEEERKFSHLRSIQTDPEFYKASYSMVTRRLPYGGKVAGREAEYTHHLLSKFTVTTLPHIPSWLIK